MLNPDLAEGGLSVNGIEGTIRRARETSSIVIYMSSDGEIYTSRFARYSIYGEIMTFLTTW